MIGNEPAVAGRGIRGNGDMLMRDKVAGFLMAIGAIGLALAPMISGPVARATNASRTNNVAIAITSGSQLHLLQEGENRRNERFLLTIERKMVCSDVFRLRIADVGLHCRVLPSALALARQ